MGIHHEIELTATPATVYSRLIDGKQFSALTGAPAAITAEEGGSFSIFGGMITGRTIELEKDRRIVQAWRVKNWRPGLYSTAHFELEPKGNGTRVVFEHTGFPEEEREHLDKGWYANYWEPLRKAEQR
jgi:activator of HSP90 ATPase